MKKSTNALSESLDIHEDIDSLSTDLNEGQIDSDTDSFSYGQEMTDQINSSEQEQDPINWLDNSFGFVQHGSLLGYYTKTYNAKKIAQTRRLTDFIIVFDEQISANVDNIPQCNFSGNFFLQNNEVIHFENFDASLLANISKLKEIIHKFCGVHARFFGHINLLGEIIKLTNKNIQRVEAQEFGYNKGFTAYFTPKTVVTAREIKATEIPILHKEQWNENQLGFQIDSKENIDELKNNVRQVYMENDSTGEDLVILAFSMLPILYPQVKPIAGGKPFLVIKGVTGTGKSVKSLQTQRFYGNFENLFSFTSTATAIGLAGYSFKDALFVVDDMKVQNISNDYERHKLMMMLQNYSDNNSRNRANTSMQVMREKPIRGFLIITGEDLIVTEGSTLARGIVVNLPKKAVNYSRIQTNNKLSKSFDMFTAHFVQHILQRYKNEELHRIYTNSAKYINEQVVKLNLEGENLPRLVNNFSLLLASWVLINRFLNQDQAIIDSYDMLFSKTLDELLVDNFNRIQSAKPEEKFEEALWQLLENGSIIIQDIIDKNTSTISQFEKNKVIGYYYCQSDGSVKLCIRLKDAYKYVNNYLSDEGGIGFSFDTLKSKLLLTGKISFPATQRVTLGGETIRGVYWTGEIPYKEIRIPEPKILDEDGVLLSSSPSEQNYLDDDLPF